MDKLIKISWLCMALVLISLAACGGGTPATPTVDANMVYTQMWQTVQIAQTLTALAIPSATNTPQETPTPEATNTPLMTDTPLPGTPSVAPNATNTPAGGSQQACDNYLFVDDVTILDNSEVTAGAAFVKTWRIKNLGPCTWTTSYRLIFGWGGDQTNWNTVAPVAFPTTVLPGDSLDISITLTAPSAAGQYAAAFRVQNDKGYNFGSSLTVLITVK